jgi:hypothetical protein
MEISGGGRTRVEGAVRTDFCGDLGSTADCEQRVPIGIMFELRQHGGCLRRAVSDVHLLFERCFFTMRFAKIMPSNEPKVADSRPVATRSITRSIFNHDRS